MFSWATLQPAEPEVTAATVVPVEMEEMEASEAPGEVESLVAPVVPVETVGRVATEETEDQVELREQEARPREELSTAPERFRWTTSRLGQTPQRVGTVATVETEQSAVMVAQEQSVAREEWAGPVEVVPAPEREETRARMPLEVRAERVGREELAVLAAPGLAARSTAPENLR
jgi:hypothetical protein